MRAIVLVLLVAYLQGSLAKSLVIQNPKVSPYKFSNDIYWFPNPHRAGGFIPAIMRGAPQKQDSITIDSMRFTLFTSERGSNNGQLIRFGDSEALANSGYIKNAPLKMLTHGFGGSESANYPKLTKDKYLTLPGPLNVIVVDWSGLSASPWYEFAATNTHRVGLRCAEYLNFLLENEVATIEDFHFIGYSLGGHVAGNTGAGFFNITGQRLPRTTSLDPAFPMFGDGKLGHDWHRVDPSDAHFVDIIHTSAGYIWEGGLGFPTSCGDADFYPNEGKHQPGCATEGDIFGSCSHGRAPEFWEESIIGSAPFKSCKCNSWSEFTSPDNCNNCAVTANMGTNLDISARGDFYLRTSDKSPYALG